METPIGKALKSDSFGLSVAVAVSSVVVSLELVLIGAGQFTQTRQYILTFAAVVAIGFLAARNRDLASFGLRLSPLQGWWYWIKAMVVIGAILLIVLAAAGGFVFGILRYPIPPPLVYLSHDQRIWPLFYWMCIFAPITEEAIYRLALCTSLTAWLGPRAAIVISGVAFAAAHVLGGHVGPDNQIAGFILAWAFLKSGSLAVPLAFHTLGNLVAPCVPCIMVLLDSMNLRLSPSPAAATHAAQ